jgi:hypothetical protein
VTDLLVTDKDPSQSGIDALLRRSMAAPVPNLPPDFVQRLTSKPPHSLQVLDRYRRALLIGYCLVSVLACTVVMRGQGLNWGTLAATILGPLALLATLSCVRRAAHPKIPRAVEMK